MVHGHVGYLREASHGDPYATRCLVPAAFATGEARIPAALLQERLPQTLQLAEERERVLYQETDKDARQQVKQSLTDFVALCAQKERETGEPVSIIASYEGGRLDQRKDAVRRLQTRAGIRSRMQQQRKTLAPRRRGFSVSDLCTAVSA